MLNTKIRFQFTNQRPYYNLMDDVKHEEDYDSEDMDVAPKTERTQHYKKLGTIWVWAFVSGTFFYSFFIEYL